MNPKGASLDLGRDTVHPMMDRAGSIAEPSVRLVRAFRRPLRLTTE